MRPGCVQRAVFGLASAALFVVLFAAPSPIQADTCSPPNTAFLTSWWSFDDVSPAVARDLWAANAGIIHGRGARTCGKVGKGLSLNGAGEYAEIFDTNTLEPNGDRTAMAWVRVAAGSSGAVLSKYPAGSGACGWALTIRADGRAEATFRNTAGTEITATSTTVVADGTFHHVAMSWSTGARNMRIYVDGIQQATVSLTGTLETPNDLPAYIGARWMPDALVPALGMFLNGVVDEAAFFGGGQLSTPEIAAIALAGSAGMCRNDPAACIPAPAGMIAWWPLDEVNVGGTPRVAQEITAGLTTTYGSSSFAPASVSGMVSRGVQCDGVNDFIFAAGDHVPALETAGAHTLDAWVKLSATGRDGAIASKLWSGLIEDGWALEVLSSGLARATVRNAAGVAYTASTTNPVADGTFHHLAMTWDTAAGTVKIYLDGVFQSQSGVVSGAFPSNDRNLYFGRGTDSGGLAIEPLAGVLDEIEFVGRELAPGEIQNIVAAGSNGKCKNVITPDLAAPVIACPAPIAVCGGPTGAVVTYVVTAADDADPAPQVVATPASGSVFPPGTTPVTATATDCTGRSASCTFTVTVSPDTAPPSITAPAPVERTLAAGDPDCSVLITNEELGQPVTSDDCSAVTVSSTGIPAGNLFPAGVTAITWHATDGSGNEASATQLVTVLGGPGAVAGHIVGSCPTPDTPLLGVRVDAFQDSTGAMLGTAVTDAAGAYEIAALPAGGYTITAVTPLGYESGDEDAHVAISCAGAANADFAFSCLAVASDPRSAGFWKHQVAVASGGPGAAEIGSARLCEDLDLIEAHFNSNEVNQVVVYVPPVSGLCADKIAVARDLLNLRGASSMTARARQQLMALLLNAADGKLSLRAVVSVDGATCSQAITYCDWLIDGPATGHELAKTIADEINNGQLVAAGVIPLSTDDIAYRRPLDAGARFDLAQNRPNPFRPWTVISFTLPAPSSYQLSIFDAAGRRVRAITGSSPAGMHRVTWDGTDEAARRVAPGVYFYRLDAGGMSATRRLIMGR